jgi:hypothetical protein
MSSNGSQSSMSDNINLTSLSPEPNPSNSFYASFKIYINKFSSGSGSPGSEKQNSNFDKTSPKKSDTNAKTKSKHSCDSSSSGGSSSSPTKIVRIEQIECDENSEFVDSGFVKTTCDETDDEVFLDAIHEPSTDGQQDDFQIKVHPPSADISRGPTPETEMASAKSSRSQRENRENSPVFYLEPDDWSDEVMPRPGVLTSPTRALSPCGPSVLTSPTRALSPCGCGKTYCNNSHMESLPEELASSASTASSVGKNNSILGPNSHKSASGNVLTLPCCSPRAAMMSELAAQQPPTRQRKVTIPILHCRAANNASMVRYKFRN